MSQRQILNRWQIQHASTSSHIVSDWRLTAVRADGARHLQKLFFQRRQIARGDLNCQTKKNKKNIPEKMKVLYSFWHKTRLDTRTRITRSREALIKKNKHTQTYYSFWFMRLWVTTLLFFSTIKTQTNIFWHNRLAWFISESSLIMSRPLFH